MRSIDPDSEESAAMTLQHQREVFALQKQYEMDTCTHEERDHGVCMNCGKDCFDDDIEAAEYARDCREDR